MVENEAQNYAMDYEATGTQLDDNDELDFHKGAENRLALEDARRLAAAAQESMQQQRREQEQNSVEILLMRYGSNIREMRRQAIAESSPVTRDDFLRTA